MKAIHQYKPLLAALVAMGVAVPAVSSLADDSATDAGRSVIATGQPHCRDRPQPAATPCAHRCRPVQELRRRLLTGAQGSTTASAPLERERVPAAPGTGPNSGDLVRAGTAIGPGSIRGPRDPLPGCDPGAGTVANVEARQSRLAWPRQAGTRRWSTAGHTEAVPRGRPA